MKADKKNESYINIICIDWIVSFMSFKSLEVLFKILFLATI